MQDVVRRILFPVVLCGWLALGVPSVFALTDEEKRELFLKSREEMRTVPAKPSVTPKPKPKPKPSTKPAPKPSLKPTPTPTPEPEPESSSAPSATPPREGDLEDAPTPTRAPAAKPTPEPKSKPQPKATPEPKAKPAPTPTEAPKSTPTPDGKAKPAASAVPDAPVTIKKSGLEKEEGLVEPPNEKRGFFSFGGPKYKYLSKSLREEIDRAKVKKKRWRFIVVHNSGSRQGNAKIFEHYHKFVRKMPNGLAYHFVIGNGTSTGNGQVEIGNRWRRQINGGHVHSDYLNNIAVGICLVGDYNRDLPTKQQLESLDELIGYIRKRVGKFDGKATIVKAHKQINPPRWPTDCPGDRFPYKWLKRYD